MGGGRQPGGEDYCKGSCWGTWVGKVVAGGLVMWWLKDWVVPHSHAGKPGGTTGERDRLCNPGFQSGEIKPQNL